MNNITEIELFNLGETVTGKTPSSNCPEDFGVNYMFVTPSDSFEYKIITKSERYLSELGANKLASKLLQPESVLVTCIGSAMGKVVINKTKCITNQQINSIRVNKNKFDSSYVYYCLKNNYPLLRNAATGSTAVPLLNKKNFDHLKIKIHSNLLTQQKIATVLSALDSKIELNNRVNAEIEAMAKTLYDYWFVQFDFPDTEGKPYKTSGGKMVWNEELKREIPEGWEAKKISDLLPVLTGKEDANFATPKGIYPFYTCAENVLRCDKSAFEGKSILLAGNGNFNIKLYEGKFNAYQRTYVLIPNNEEYYTIVYLAVKDKIKSLTNSSRGSIIKFITKGDIEDIIIALPPSGFSNLFGTLNTTTKKIQINNEENQKLSELRDWLLPMLMNGQVRVD